MFIDNIVKKLFDRVKNVNASIKEEAFVVVLNIGTVGALIGLVSCLISKQYDSLLTVGATAFLCIAACVLCKKVKNIKWVISGLLISLDCVVFPVMYFFSGGIDSGMFLWFTMLFCISMMVFDWKLALIICPIQLILDVGAAYYGYLHPEKIQGRMTEHGVYVDVLIAFIVLVVSFAVVSAYIIYRMEQIKTDLEVAKKEAEIATEAKSRFLATMSHEIRTPLNAILNLNEDILATGNIDEIKQNATDVKYSAVVLSGIINDVLDFSKIEQGKFTITEAGYSSNELLEIINIVGADAKAKGLDYSVNISKENPLPDELFGDVVRIKQIITNLISNATKFTEAGGVKIELTFEKPAELSEGILTISVSDTGVGIKEEELPHIFEAFERLETNQNGYVQGTGLGLAITKSFVEMMDGQITVDSEPGKGTTFVVKLPQGISNSLKDDETTYDFSGLNVLVCDDNLINIKVFNKVVEDTNISVTEAVSAEEAIACTKEKTFDVIFLDYQMPFMNGKECMDEMRKQGVKSPILVLSADSDGDVCEKYISMGFDDCVAKPIDRLALFRKIYQLCNK